jgi:hypothetical protein
LQKAVSPRQRRNIPARVYWILPSLPTTTTKDHRNQTMFIHSTTHTDDFAFYLVLSDISIDDWVVKSKDLVCQPLFIVDYSLSYYLRTPTWKQEHLPLRALLSAIRSLVPESKVLSDISGMGSIVCTTERAVFAVLTISRVMKVLSGTSGIGTGACTTEVSALRTRQLSDALSPQRCYPRLPTRT